MTTARRIGISPSGAFRRIVAKLKRGGLPSGKPMVQEVMSKKVRVELRLTKGEIATASEIARHEGFSLTRWIVALINTRLYATPQLGQRELETLARSHMQMLAIGRNLSQLACAANAGVSITRAGGPDIIEVLRAACCAMPKTLRPQCEQMRKTAFEIMHGNSFK